MRLKTLAIPVLLCILCGFASPRKLSAQDSVRIAASNEQPESFWRRIAVGGNLGFQFGNVTSVLVSPEARIRLFGHFYGGIGFTYQYIQYRDYYYDPPNQDYIDFRSYAYGGKLYLRYYMADLFDNFLANLYAHAEYEYLVFIQPLYYDPSGIILDPYNNTYSRGKESIEINSLFIGPGYSQPLGGKAFLDFQVLFNLNDTYNSPYSNPVIRIGFGVGL